MTFFINVLVSALVVSFSAWLSGRFPTLAGFMVALPVATMLVLPMSHVQHGVQENTFLLARSIFVAIPISLGFFLPFLLSDRLQLSFWQAYVIGAGLLPVGYFLHRAVTRVLF